MRPLQQVSFRSFLECVSPGVITTVGAIFNVTFSVCECPDHMCSVILNPRPGESQAHEYEFSALVYFFLHRVTFPTGAQIRQASLSCPSAHGLFFGVNQSTGSLKIQLSDGPWIPQPLAQPLLSSPACLPRPDRHRSLQGWLLGLRLPHSLCLCFTAHSRELSCPLRGRLVCRE